MRRGATSSVRCGGRLHKSPVESDESCGIFKLEDRMRDTNDEGSVDIDLNFQKLVADATNSGKPIPKISNV